MLYFLVSVVVVYFVVKEIWMRWKYDLHRIPAPPKLPFLGHALKLRKAGGIRPLNVWIREWREKLGFPKLMRMCVFGRTIVIVCDINIVRQTILTKSDSPQRTGPLFREFHRMLMGDDLTPCLATSPDATPHVKAVRRSYAASFTTAGMRLAFKKQVEEMEKGKLYIDANQDRESIDLQDFFTRLMLDVAGKVELDSDLGGLDNSTPLFKLIVDCGRHVMSLGSIPFAQWRMKLFPNSKFAKTINKDFDDFLEQWTRITNEVCAREQREEECATFSDHLRNVKIPGTDDPLPFNLLRGEIATAILAGFDTSSHQLAWIFALLATHPIVVEKLLDELKTHGLYGEGARELEFEDLGELEYLGAVIKEGMRRIHTVQVVSARSAHRDLVLDQYRVPKGTVFFVCSNSSMNCEMEWEDHLAFKPERWLNGQLNVREKYYIPFGLGERDCVGMKFALQSMKIAMVYLLTRFSFELVGDTVESLIENGVSRTVFEAENGINMKITPRTET